MPRPSGFVRAEIGSELAAACDLVYLAEDAKANAGAAKPDLTKELRSLAKERRVPEQVRREFQALVPGQP